MVFIPKNRPFRLQRSALFMSSSNERALKKAHMLACDCLIFDLEDAVADSERENALENLKTLVKGADFGNRERIIRVNAVDSAEFTEGMTIAVACGVDAVLLPKAETVDAVKKTAAHLKSASSQAAIWAMIES